MRFRTPALVLLAIAAAVIAFLVLRSGDSGQVRHANPGNFKNTFADADTGDTIVLASGNYGLFKGAKKDGIVTIRAQRGARATMALKLSPARNLTFDGLRLTEIEIDGKDTKNITIRNSNIPGPTVLRTGNLANANILFDHNVHGPWDKCKGCYEGRLQLAEQTDQPSGITIENSRFGPGGNSDGIQNGSNGTRILNNEFVEIKQRDGDPVHADSIQLYGSKNTVIRGNWFHRVSTGVMCPDGCDHEVIEDNVFEGNETPYVMQLLSDNGSTLRHNTFVDGRCSFRQRCGVLYLGHKKTDPRSRGTIVKDNIITRICLCEGDGSGLADESHNLLTEQRSRGRADLLGAPTFAGGARPRSYAGFALAKHSRGRRDASDHRDRGIRLDPAR